MMGSALGQSTVKVPSPLLMAEHAAPLQMSSVWSTSPGSKMPLFAMPSPSPLSSPLSTRVPPALHSSAVASLNERRAAALVGLGRPGVALITLLAVAEVGSGADLVVAQLTIAIAVDAGIYPNSAGWAVVARRLNALGDEAIAAKIVRAGTKK